MKVLPFCAEVDHQEMIREIEKLWGEGEHPSM